ncbi:hypothetical protein KIL84_016043 [Mauremys mutica]|uniref:Uncharacterized protein n=1 Tax=Mauremys mutica TaxID=74926 RepID=A0A9D3WTU0_9SAUR|nr:hypothetical protein KIL84_016043 [Mauremys mutica]
METLSLALSAQQPLGRSDTGGSGDLSGGLDAGEPVSINSQMHEEWMRNEFSDECESEIKLWTALVEFSREGGSLSGRGSSSGEQSQNCPLEAHAELALEETQNLSQIKMRIFLAFSEEDQSGKGPPLSQHNT